jgi:hypothetical protein
MKHGLWRYVQDWREHKAPVYLDFRNLAQQLDEGTLTEEEYQLAVSWVGFDDLYASVTRYSNKHTNTTLLYELLESLAGECGFCDQTHWCARLLRTVLSQTSNKERKTIRVTDGIGITLYSRQVWNWVCVMPFPLIRVFCRYSGLARQLASESLDEHWSMLMPRSAIFALVDQMCEETWRFRLTALPSLLRGAYLLREPESRGLRWLRGWTWWLLCAKIDGQPLSVPPRLLCVLGNADLRRIVAEYVM